MIALGQTRMVKVIALYKTAMVKAIAKGNFVTAPSAASKLDGVGFYRSNLMHSSPYAKTITF